MDALSLATHPLAAAALLAMGLLSTWALMKMFGAPPAQGRYVTIDGLRGYLAFFVFVHHSCIWYFYLHGSTWSKPPSALYRHFGQSTVAVFFMITGFLFFSKLMDSRDKGVDWAKLFVSRILRLVPLYLVLMAVVAALVVLQSNGVLQEPWQQVLGEAGQWLLFTMPGMPNINGVHDTSTMVAGVTWSLPYEWYFYLSLPLLALTLKIRVPRPYLLIGVLGLVCMLVSHPGGSLLTSFLGGVLSAILVRKPPFTAFARTHWATVLVLICPVLTVTLYPELLKAKGAFLLCISFALVAGGNSLFGILLAPLSRTLGEMAYGLYLLHGMVLYVLFHVVVGMGEAASWSPVKHWAVIAGVTPLLVGLCFLAFRFVERPAMHRTVRVTAWLRSRFGVQDPMLLSKP